MQVAVKDLTELLIEELDEVISNFKRRVAEQPMPCGSRALAFAMQAGLPPRMTYNVADTARYIGVDVNTLYHEHDAGRLDFIIPKGKSRGARIKVDEVDRWLNEN